MLHAGYETAQHRMVVMIKQMQPIVPSHNAQHEVVTACELSVGWRTADPGQEMIEDEPCVQHSSARR